MDTRKLIAITLKQHGRRTDPNHPGWPNCRCGFNCEDGDWSEHAADEVAKVLTIQPVSTDL